MPFSRRMAEFNQHFTNHVTRHIASWAPGFALLEHVGRRSGVLYETPVNVFRAEGRYLFTDLRRERVGEECACSGQVRHPNSPTQD